MKSQKSLVFLYVFVAVALIGLASAADIANPTTLTTEFNGVTLGTGVDLVIDSEANVEVVFTAVKNASDVKVKVELFGKTDTVFVGDVVAGKTYKKSLSLESLSGIDSLSEEYTFYVMVFNNVDKTELSYTVTIQRESYQMKILSADFSSQVEAGKTFPISVVLKNIGYNDLEDAYVSVSIPELGVSTRSYAGDIASLDNDDDDDAKEVVLYLKVPEKAAAGVYTVLISVYDNDKEAEVSATKLISISGSTTTNFVVPTKNQDLTAGKTTYEVVVINNGDSVKILPITTLFGNSLNVYAPSMVTIAPKSSEVVTIEVAQTEAAEVGTYSFTTVIDGEALVFTANVVSESTMSGSVIALLAILSVIFVVLLVVLIVLISKKDKTVEEVETSYY